MYGYTLRDVDIWTSSMAHSLASVGGFCAGTQLVCDHQKLSAAGYVFSAASPAFTNAAACASLKLLQERPEVRRKVLDNAKLLHALVLESIEFLTIDSDACSPICHIRIDHNSIATATAGEDHINNGHTNIKSTSVIDDKEEKDDSMLLDRIVEYMLSQGVVVCRSRYAPHVLFPLPRPSIRIIVTGYHTSSDVQQCVKILHAAANHVLSQYQPRIHNKPVSGLGSSSSVSKGTVKDKEVLTHTSNNSCGKVSGAGSDNNSREGASTPKKNSGRRNKTASN